MTSEELIAFLNGEGPLDGKWFGEKDEKGRAFWWRKYLPKAKESLPQGDELRDRITRDIEAAMICLAKRAEEIRTHPPTWKELAKEAADAAITAIGSQSIEGERANGRD